MNCGANVLDELFRLTVDWARMREGKDGEEASCEKEWFLEWQTFWSEGELTIIDFGRPPGGYWEGRMGARDGDEDGDGEALLKGLRRVGEPFNVGFVMMVMKHRKTGQVPFSSKLYRSWIVRQGVHVQVIGQDIISKGASDRNEKNVMVRRTEYFSTVYVRSSSRDTHQVVSIVRYSVLWSMF